MDNLPSYSSLIEETGLRGLTNIGSIVNKLVPYIFIIAGIVLLLYLIFGGIQLMTSGGEPKSIQAAKNKVTNALIGFIIIFVAYWIVLIVGKVLGIEGFKGAF